MNQSENNANHTDNGDKKFHGWRLVGVIVLVTLVLAAVSALIDFAALD